MVFDVVASTAILPSLARWRALEKNQSKGLNRQDAKSAKKNQGITIKTATFTF